MNLEKGFKFLGDYFDVTIVTQMSYDELEFLIEQVSQEINKTIEIIKPFELDLKNGKECPDHIVKKLKYKDALSYFQKDLRECLVNKKRSIERKFFQVCQEEMDEEQFEEIKSKAEKLS